MDGYAFDRLVKDAARRPTRRATLRLLAGGLIGGLLAQGGAALTRAAQRPDRDQDGLYDDDEVEVYGTNPDVYDSDGDGVGDGEEVYVGTDPRVNENAPVGCGAGLTDCGGICVDTVNDRLNCGACGAACAEFVNCWESNCGGIPDPPPATCAAQGLGECPGPNGPFCTNLWIDPNNCGYCGTSCLQLGGVCCNGVCQDYNPNAVCRS
jgi:hypothetical protein